MDAAEQVHRGADHRDPAEQEAGAKTADVCRKHGIGPATFHQWKAKYGGLEVSEARRLRALEAENAPRVLERPEALLSFR